MVEAFVLITCDLGKEEQIVQDLKNIDNVKEVQATVGAYDIIAKVESETKSELRNTIQSQILGMEPVLGVLTLQSISV
ncbi:MAG: Lrp/AsnC ligand binding domain-containing protein [Nitrosopumilaceae archaeon]